MYKSNYSVTKIFKFCAAHRLFKYTGKCANIHGHNYRVHVTLASSKLDSLGMVVDFGTMKTNLGGWIDTNLDHHLLIHADDAAMIACARQLQTEYRLMPCNPTAENIAELIRVEVQNLIVDCEVMTCPRVVVFETDSSYASVGV